MSVSPGSKSDKKLLVVVIPLVIMLIPLGYSAVAWALSMGPDDGVAFLEKPDAQFEECVEDTEYMRFNHWVLLKTARDEAVRKGNRGEIGLARLKQGGHEDGRQYCSDCHTSRERFCTQCHSAVNLTPNCFECHEYR